MRVYYTFDSVLSRQALGVAGQQAYDRQQYTAMDGISNILIKTAQLRRTMYIEN